MRDYRPTIDVVGRTAVHHDVEALVLWGVDTDFVPTPFNPAFALEILNVTCQPRLPPNRSKCLRQGFGYVEFETERGAGTCVRTQEGLSIGGRPVVIDFETGAPKGSFRRQDGAQIKKTSADAGVGKGKPPKFKVHA